MSDSIQALVTAAKAGDPAAEAELAGRAATLALRAANVAAGDQHAAADISQEVAVRALRGLPRLRDSARFDGWVHQITVAEIRRYYGRRRPDAELPLEAADDMAARPDARASFARPALRVALADLTTRERTAIALRYVFDLTDRQIAAAMRCRPGTARSLLSRGLTRLATHPELEGLVESPLEVSPSPAALKEARA